MSKEKPSSLQSLKQNFRMIRLNGEPLSVPTVASLFLRLIGLLTRSSLKTTVILGVKMKKTKAKKITSRNWIAVAAFQRSGGGKHANKSLRGSGKGSGKAGRNPKHKGSAEWK